MTDVTSTSKIRNAVPWGGITCLAIEPYSSYAQSDTILLADSSGNPIKGISTILGCMGLCTGASPIRVDFSSLTITLSQDPSSNRITLVLVWGK